MKQFFKMFFASLLAMIISGVIIVVVFIAAVTSLVTKTTSPSAETGVAEGSVLVIDLNRRLHEQGEVNSLAAFDNDPSFSAGLYEAVKAIEHAGSDNNIRGILLKLDRTPNGWATVQQLRQALLSFKKSGKFLYAYGVQIPQRAYYVGTAADSIFLNPIGYAELKGLATELAFFKGTLEKLEINPELFYAGKYKSAIEPFRSDRISEPNREQIEALQKSIWTGYLNSVSEHTKLDTASLQRLTATGAIQFADEALRYRYVDRLAHGDEIETLLRKKTGLKATEKVKYVSLDRYAERLKSVPGLKEDRIAVLFAEGEIVDGEKTENYQIASEDLVKSIRQIRDNDKIKAVVLRVNSPGGSALASEVIHRELIQLKRKKPLIASMGDLAASGGYYISCAADSIFAMPATITGSIGVFGVLFNIEGLMKNKLGITFDQVKNADYADFPTVTRMMTPEETARMQRSVDTIYGIFKRRVSEGRKMDAAMVDSIAQGRVWTGADALKIGLVDAPGDLDRAIASAATRAGLKSYKVVTYPDRIDKLEKIMRRFDMASVSAGAVKAELRKELGTDYDLIQQLKSLRNMNGKVLMAMPYRLDVK